MGGAVGPRFTGSARTPESPEVANAGALSSAKCIGPPVFASLGIARARRRRPERTYSSPGLMRRRSGLEVTMARLVNSTSRRPSTREQARACSAVVPLHALASRPRGHRDPRANRRKHPHRPRRPQRGEQAVLNVDVACVAIIEPEKEDREYRNAEGPHGARPSFARDAGIRARSRLGPWTRRPSSGRLRDPSEAWRNVGGPGVLSLTERRSGTLRAFGVATAEYASRVRVRARSRACSRCRRSPRGSRRPPRGFPRAGSTAFRCRRG